MPCGIATGSRSASRKARRNRCCRSSATSSAAHAPQIHRMASAGLQWAAVAATTGAGAGCTTTCSTAGTIVTTTWGCACGSWLAINANSGSHHSRHACSTPNQRRHGVRSAATITSAALRASVAVHNRCSRSIAFIIELRNKPPDFADVLLRQLALLAEVRDQWRHPSAEQAIEQALALLEHITVAREQRAVQITAAIA